ncbi:hypothetical protein BH23DEI1_BH23DEI1_10350 [soil metagenome]
MTTATIAPRTMTYARARLFLGASAVGTTVVIASIALIADLPHRLLPNAPGALTTDVALLGLVVALHAALLAPFDLFGGALLPREYGRSSESLGRFAGRWLRGAVGYGALLTLAGSGLLIASRSLGGAGTVIVCLLGWAILLTMQPRIASLLGAGPIRLVTEPSLAPLGRDVFSLQSRHPHVTGGAFGLPGRTRWVVAERWLERADDVALPVQVVRRAWLTSSGARDRGVALALAWNVAPVLVAIALLGPPTSVADVVRLGLLTTLWSFVGLLTLPTPSRWAVHRADLAARTAGVERRTLATSLVALERDQDDELERSRGVETIFHPIPSTSRRLAHASLEKRLHPSDLSTWHAARLALYVSVVGFGLLGRSVHCTLGRPEVWVFLPSD